MKKFEYVLVDYFDVWGNQEDGYEVNNLCRLENIKIVVDENYTIKDLVKILKEQNYLLETVSEDDFDVQDDFEMIEFEYKKTGMPLFRLELVIEY